MKAIRSLIYGTAWKKERTAELVAQALSLGFRAIDTAGQPKHYNEAGVGEGLKRALAGGLQREELFIQTKFTPLAGQDPERLPYDPSRPLREQVLQSFAGSQKNLHSEFVDSLVLHSPLGDWEKMMEVWQAMESLVDQGLVGQLGLSNCYDLELFAQLCEKVRVQPRVLQNRFYRDTGYDQELRRYCLEGAKEPVIYQSFWTLTANPHLLQHPVIQDLAQARNKTPAQIFFRYLTQLGIQPLTGTTSEQHMREDLAIFEFTLEEAELKALEVLGLRVSEY